MSTQMSLRERIAWVESLDFEKPLVDHKPLAVKIGMVHYNWTVTGTTPGKRSMVKMVCKCGTTWSAQLHYFRSIVRDGITRSCKACSFKEPMPGERIHSWTVVGNAYSGTKAGRSCRLIRVKCACGHEQDNPLSALRLGRTKQCTKCAYKNRRRS